MTTREAVDYIFDHMDEFEAKYAGTIEAFEAKGVEHALAKAMAIEIAAKAKAISDLMAEVR